MAEAEPPGRTIGDLLNEARRRLRESGIAEPDLDARILAAEALGLDATRLFLDAGRAAGDDARSRLSAMLRRRETGEPVHRILGRRAFFEHEFELSPETLEPRPDTEALVELAAEALRRRGDSNRSLLFADLGTGTGAIAVSLLALFPQARALAVDISPGALVTARRNAERAGVSSRFLPLAGDYLAAAGATLDMIVSNPPYIPTEEIEGLSREVRDFDPRLALDGGADGLSAYRSIMRDAALRLAPDGDLLLEVGAGQAADVRSTAALGGFRHIRSRADLSGVERALWFRRDSEEE